MSSDIRWELFRSFISLYLLDIFYDLDATKFDSMHYNRNNIIYAVKEMNRIWVEDEIKLRYKKRYC